MFNSHLLKKVKINGNELKLDWVPKLLSQNTIYPSSSKGFDNPKVIFQSEGDGTMIFFYCEKKLNHSYIYFPLFSLGIGQGLIFLVEGAILPPAFLIFGLILFLGVVSLWRKEITFAKELSNEIMSIIKKESS